MEVSMFKASISTIFLRFCLMTGVVILGLFTGQTWLYFFGFLILITCMTGMAFHRKAVATTTKMKTVRMNPSAMSGKQAV